MGPVSANYLLGVLERGRGLHPVDRALTLLQAAFPATDGATLASLSIGERDRLLIGLREQAFGLQLRALADCPQCGDRLEFSLSTSDLQVPTPPVAQSGRLEFEVDGQRFAFRPVNSYDLAAVAEASSADEARQQLARRCLLNDAGDAALPAAMVDELAMRLAECDPQAEVLLDLACPSCGHPWQLAFDIASFLWSEVAIAARRVLLEVDALARAYGWREADILAMTPARRQLYLEVVG